MKSMFLPPTRKRLIKERRPIDDIGYNNVSH
jgi:hypothetical protein